MIAGYQMSFNKTFNLKRNLSNEIGEVSSSHSQLNTHILPEGHARAVFRNYIFLDGYKYAYDLDGAK